MADQPKKIIVDDDWKAQAQAEKERLSEQIDQRAKPAGPSGTPGGAEMPEAGAPAGQVHPYFAELINLLMMQALGGLGMLASPAGERIPGNLQVARYFIDMLEILQEKTRNNLTPDEQKLMGDVLYDLRLNFVELAKAAAAKAQQIAAGPGAPAGPKQPG